MPKQTRRRKVCQAAEDAANPRRPPLALHAGRVLTDEFIRYRQLPLLWRHAFRAARHAKHRNDHLWAL